MNLSEEQANDLLGIAAELGWNVPAKFAISRGANPGYFRDGRSCLHLAAEKGDVDMLRILVAAGADLNVRSLISAETPLIAAAKAGNSSACEMLLKAGADSSIRDDHSKCALDYAVEHDAQYLIRLFSSATLWRDKVNCAGRSSQR